MPNVPRRRCGVVSGTRTTEPRSTPCSAMNCFRRGNRSSVFESKMWRGSWVLYRHFGKNSAGDFGSFPEPFPHACHSISVEFSRTTLQEKCDGSGITKRITYGVRK